MPDATWSLGVLAAALVADESFATLSAGYEEERARTSDALVRVRSLTKDHAIPGVRVGYLLAGSRLARRLEAARPSWSTSAAVLAAALAACELDEWLAAARRALLDERRRLASLVRDAGYSTHEGVAPFFLVEVPDAGRWTRLLLERDLAVRDCTSFGLPRHLRIGPRLPAEGDRLVAALRDLAAREPVS